ARHRQRRRHRRRRPAYRLHARDSNHRPVHGQQPAHREPQPSPDQGHRQVQSVRVLAHLHADHLRVFILMKNIQRSIGRDLRRTQAGFSLVEVMVSVGIMTVIMGSTMVALSQAMKANETAQLVTVMNNSLRTGMDLMIRDMLQVGSGLPTGHFILIPSGDGGQMNMPGPPGTLYKSVIGDTDLNAVNPGTKLGPLVNLVGGGACSTEGPGCVKTDTITTLAADSTFNDIYMTARAANGTWIDVDPLVNIGTGPDRVIAGQLIMLQKISYAILVQVTSVDAS